MTRVKNNDESEKLIEDDPWLGPYRDTIQKRFDSSMIYKRHTLTTQWLDKMDSTEKGFENFTLGYQYFGFNISKTSITWVPNGSRAFLIGEFNEWNRESHEMNRNSYGVFEIVLPIGSIPHNTKIKISIITHQGDRIERIPAYITRATQDLSKSQVYDAVFWNPPVKYKFKHPVPPKPESPIIYEAHVGIASPDPKVSTYKEFTQNVLPRISALGYNTIQLMAIMEHPYYASFGYQVTSFYAPSSRFGTPEDLKELLDVAHSYGLTVLLDIVHSHASNNVLDGLNKFDGSDSCYFHSGEKGRHSLWDSRLFDYGNHEVLRFLLSNLRYWIEEFHFDGFRFDGVTSMLYLHHGIGTGFGGGYDDYFGQSVDTDAVVYLTLANHIMHSLYPNIMTIAEDVSGMPTLCRTFKEGGIGFDYRLSMAIPDMWIKLLKEKQDQDWDIGNIVHTLTNRRWKEKTISYAESHDQALVGDKTIAFWLMDKEMYENMSTLSPLTPVIDRGLSLHKLIRLLTYSLGGQGYLNFMGNEFGHPEWLDFPREGNQSSYHYARRQYPLSDDPLLRYKYLALFDKSMHTLNKSHHLLSSDSEYVSLKHQQDKIIVFEKSDLLFIFNFNATESFSDYRVGTCWPGPYSIELCSDAGEFGGHGRVEQRCVYESVKGDWNGRDYWIQVYIPNRTVLVLRH